MQNTPSAYKSTVLAQAALLNNPLKSFESSPINGKIKANSHELQMPNISTVPSLNTSNNQPLRSDFGMPLKQLVELFARKAKSVYEHVLISERGEGVLTKALQYNIPFNKHNIDWLDLMDEVNEYEDLIEQSNQLNIDWDLKYYDPVGLEQEILIQQNNEYECNNYIRAAYYAAV